MKNNPTSETLKADIQLLCRVNGLAEILSALSQHCIVRAKELLNEDKAQDEYGTRAITWLEFERRIKHLARSAKRKKEGYSRAHKQYRGVTMKEVKDGMKRFDKSGGISDLAMMNDGDDLD